MVNELGPLIQGKPKHSFLMRTTVISTELSGISLTGQFLHLNFPEQLRLLIHRNHLRLEVGTAD